MWGSNITSLLWVVVCILVILGAAYWFTRHVVGTGLYRPGGVGANSRGMEILAQRSLGKEQRLLVAQIGERCFLLGVSAGSISNLAELTAEEAEFWKNPPEGAQPSGFRDQFSRILQRKDGDEGQ
jgi:flagellar biosynthetic protein FliO